MIPLSPAAVALRQECGRSFPRHRLRSSRDLLMSLTPLSPLQHQRRNRAMLPKISAICATPRVQLVDSCCAPSKPPLRQGTIPEMQDGSRKIILRVSRKQKEEDISGQKCVVRSSPSHSLAQPWPSRGWPRSSARPQPSRLPRVRFLVSQYSDDSIQGACDARPVPLLGGAVQVGNSIGKAKSLGAVGMGSDDCN